MTDYTRQELTIADTDRIEIACALATLSGFPEGSAVRRMRSGNDLYGIVFHKETKDEAPTDFLATRQPDISVQELGDNRYAIEFNERVRPNDIGRIEEEIRRST